MFSTFVSKLQDIKADELQILIWVATCDLQLSNCHFCCLDFYRVDSDWQAFNPKQIPHPCVDLVEAVSAYELERDGYRKFGLTQTAKGLIYWFCFADTAQNLHPKETWCRR